MRILPMLARTMLVVSIAASASAVTMAWTPIGNPGNPADTEVMDDGTTGYGSVGYAYSIGTYEVTNGQYAEFLNAVGKVDPNGLYSSAMGSAHGPYGGIERSGNSGSYSYTVVPGRGDMPVNYVSWFNALRFANWMNNGQPSGPNSASSTEVGAYTFSGPETVGARNTNAMIVLANENEWYKAAYYDPSTNIYFDYPTRSNGLPVCSLPTSSPNHANCAFAAGNFAAVGSYAGSPSPYGTFDQGGNASEWTEQVGRQSGYYHYRGGSFIGGSDAFFLKASRHYTNAPYGNDGTGFRLAFIPEPTTGLLVIAGLVGLAVRRKIRA